MEMTFLDNRNALVLRGLAGVGFGLVAFFLPFVTLAGLVLMFGAYAFLDGILAIAAATHPKMNSRPALLVFEGVVGIGVGVASVLWTGATAVVLTSLIAFWAIVTGGLEVAIAARMARRIPGRRYLLVTGALSLIFGTVVLLFPIAGAYGLILLLGAYALTFGTTLLLLAWRLHRFARRSDVLARDLHPLHPAV